MVTPSQRHERACPPANRLRLPFPARSATHASGSEAQGQTCAPSQALLSVAISPREQQRSEQGAANGKAAEDPPPGVSGGSGSRQRDPGRAAKRFHRRGWRGAMEN